MGRACLLRHSARQTVLRFSRNARMPSLASLPARTLRAISRMSSWYASYAPLIVRRTAVFIVRTAIGELPAILSAHASAVSSSFALGTTSCTIPIWNARCAIDRRDRRRWQFFEAFEDLDEIHRRGAGALEPFGFGKIESRAKALARATHDDGADFLVLFDRGDRLIERPQQRFVERVALLGAVHRDDREILLALDLENLLGHRSTPWQSIKFRIGMRASHAPRGPFKRRRCVSSWLVRTRNRSEHGTEQRSTKNEKLRALPDRFALF